MGLPLGNADGEKPEIIADLAPAGHRARRNETRIACG